MILIQYKKNEGLITIETQIHGTPTWYYYYQEDQLHENDNAVNKPKEHTIGKPHELVKTIHNWEFRLANPSANTISANVTIEWFQIQQGNKVSIGSWSKQNISVPANGAAPSGESAFMTAI